MTHTSPARGLAGVWKVLPSLPSASAMHRVCRSTPLWTHHRTVTATAQLASQQCWIGGAWEWSSGGAVGVGGHRQCLGQGAVGLRRPSSWSLQGRRQRPCAVPRPGACLESCANPWVAPVMTSSARQILQKHSCADVPACDLIVRHVII